MERNTIPGPIRKGEPGEKVELFGKQVTLVGPSITRGTFVRHHRKREGETVIIRLPSACLPEGWEDESPNADTVAEEAGDKDRAFALTEGEKKALKQFSEMLYDADGNPKPSGYLALLRLQERLHEKRDQAVDDLELLANTIAKYRKRDMVPVSRGEYVTELTKTAVENYYTVQDRLTSLGVVLGTFESRGTPPTEWDLVKGKREEPGNIEQTALDVKLDAIKKVVTDPELLRGLRYNTELYRKADEKENIGYKEPEDAFRKDINKNFPDRFGHPVPEDPEEWRRFFESGKRNGKPYSDPGAPESGTESP